MDPTTADGARLTADLNRALQGDLTALDRHFPKLARELEKIAEGRLRTYRKRVSVDSRSLWHDLYQRLPELAVLEFESRGHFFKIASMWMKNRILDSARRRRALKRGGGAVRTTLSEAPVPGQSADVLVIAEALAKLRKVDAGYAEIVEMRFFAGLDIAEMSEALDLSAAEIHRRLQAAKQWLAGHLEPKAAMSRVAKA